MRNIRRTRHPIQNRRPLTLPSTWPDKSHTTNSFLPGIWRWLASIYLLRWPKLFRSIKLRNTSRHSSHRRYNGPRRPRIHKCRRRHSFQQRRWSHDDVSGKDSNSHNHDDRSLAFKRLPHIYWKTMPPVLSRSQPGNVEIQYILQRTCKTMDLNRFWGSFSFRKHVPITILATVSRFWPITYWPQSATTSAIEIPNFHSTCPLRWQDFGRVFVCKFCPIPDGVNRPSLHYTTSHRWISYYRSNPRCVDKVLQINWSI